MTVCPSRKERLIYVGISVENIITPSVSVSVPTASTCSPARLQTPPVSSQVEEEPKPEIIKEKKEVKKMKSWGRRSTRTKKSISYRSESVLTLISRISPPRCFPDASSPSILLLDPAGL